MQQTIDLSILLPENANNTLLEQGIAQLQEYQAMRQLYNGAIREITTKLENLDDEFSTRYAHNPIHHMESRLKSLKSIVGKLHRKGLPLTLASAQEELFDIAGVRVICNYIDDIYDLANMLCNQGDVAVLRRRGAKPVYACGALVVDANSAQITVDGRPAALTAQEYRLLLLLISQPGRVWERGQLLQTLWDGAGAFVEDNTLTVTIKRLREKLGPEGGRIATVRGFGYRWEEKQ